MDQDSLESFTSLCFKSADVKCFSKGTVNIIRVLVYWHSYVHHGGFNLVHITYQISVAVFGILVGPAVMFVMLQAGLNEVSECEPKDSFFWICCVCCKKIIAKFPAGMLSTLLLQQNPATIIHT